MEPKVCPMCTQGMAFNESINKQLSTSVLITKKKDTNMHFLNVFVSTKEGNDGKAPENIGGAAIAIKACPWCGRMFDEE